MPSETDLSWLDDDEQVDEPGLTVDTEEEDINAKARLDAELEAGDETDQESTSAPDEDDAGANALLRWDETKDNGKAEADALFAEQVRQAERLSPDYVPPPEPLTTMEEAAVRASRMSREELDDFSAQLRAANEKQARQVRANQPGYDDSGEPVVATPPFDPTGLSSGDFQIFIEAVKSGGADPRKVPSGESYDSWRAKVESSMAGGVDRG